MLRKRKRKIRCKYCKHFIGGGEINEGSGLCAKWYPDTGKVCSVSEWDSCPHGDEKKTKEKTGSDYYKVISDKHKIMSECGISEDVFNLFVIFIMTYGFENGNIPEEMYALLPESMKKALNILRE